jgi:hypothetical protein
MAADIVVCIVSAVDSEALLWEILGGLNSVDRGVLAAVPAAGDGNAVDIDEVENVDDAGDDTIVGDASGTGEAVEREPSVTVSSVVRVREFDGCVQDANAAK